MKGKIVLFSGNKLISWAIKLCTWSKWSHAGILIENDDGSVNVYEALKEGFVKSNYALEDLKSLISKGDVEILVPVIKIKPQRLETSSKALLGEPYGYLDIFLILVDIISRMWKGRDLYVLDTNRQIICSEAVARVLYDASDKQIDFVREFKKPYSYITPKDLSLSEQLRGGEL